jgi:phosphoribosyl 1,2-cyclic phosphate phosphodiesterase
MKIQFLGTSASPSMPLPFCVCEVCRAARQAGGKNLRRRASLLINDEVLIDLGPDSVSTAFTYDIPLTHIRLCLQTHPHEDHFDPELIISRHAEYGTTLAAPLMLAGSRQTLEALDNLIQKRCAYGSLFSASTQQALGLEIKEITPYARYAIGPYKITGYPANHATEHTALLYSIAYEDHTIFYGTDTAPLFDAVWQDLIAKGIRYDLFILDHTYGSGYPSTDHLAAEDFIRHVDRIHEHRLLKETGRIYATHLSHEGIQEHATLQQFANRYGYHIAYDGLVVNL